jgi:hypothetical protein
MDNLGDWLYVLFLIVVGVSGFISSAKKKRIQQEEEKGSQHEIVVEHEVVAKPTPVRALVRPKKKKVDVAKKPEMVTSLEPSSPLVAEEFYDPEALRKAIIYTEIFNRKY